MKEVVQRRMYYLFSPFLRIFHWVMVDSIIVLVCDGYPDRETAGNPESWNRSATISGLMDDYVRKHAFPRGLCVLCVVYPAHLRVHHQSRATGFSHVSGRAFL
jgi:Ni,Fe-hydrogenase I cytochrome b subunit